MNIIYVRVNWGNNISVSSDAVYRGLTKLGHKIAVVERIDQIPTEKYDWVWSPYEHVTLLGDKISKKLNIPHFTHIEWFAPYRILDNLDYENYGIIDENDPERHEIKKFKESYLKIAKVWEQAQIKTLSTPIRLPLHKKIVPNVKNVQFRFPSIDVVGAEKIKQVYNPKRINNNIITITRLISSKRIDLLINAMNLITIPVIWTIIGDGYLDIKKKITNTNITLNLIGQVREHRKWYELLKAKVLLYAAGGMPPMEATIMNCQSVLIESPSTRDIPENNKFLYSNFGDSVPIFKYNESQKAASKLEKIIQNKTNTLEEYNTLEKFLSGKTNVTSADINAKDIINRIKKYEKNN